MAKPAITIEAGMDEAGTALGAIIGMTKTVTTNKWIVPVLEMAHAEMAREFDTAADLIHAAAPNKLHHVYDWETVGGKGIAGGRLWRHMFLGNGTNREATFEFIASRKPIPSPEERAGNSNDPMSLVPPDDIARLSKRKYFFYWKAPVMEYNTPVNIVPKHAKRLFIPTGDAGRPFTFAKYVRNLNPGGQETTGAFTALWTDWWNGSAEAVFNDKIQRILEADLSSIPMSSRSRTKTVNVSTLRSFQDAMAAGEELSAAYLRGRAKSYSAAKRYIAENL